MINSQHGRNNLVIVRAGQRSLHRAWLKQAYDQRSFDVLVSYFDATAFANHEEEEGVTAILNPGGKWDGLHQAIEWLGERLDRYDYIWLPDDDIETTGPVIDEIFQLMRRHDLSVAQPSLTPDSYYTHFLFINCPGLHMRRTNYVEIMVPCLTRDLLRAVKHHFKGSMSGFGLDYTWCRLQEAGVGRAAIFDCITVKHTRPVGNVLIATMTRSGINPKDEEARLNALYGITERVTPLAYAAVTDDGKTVTGKARTGLTMARRHAQALWSHPSAVRHFDASRIVQLLRRQLTRRLDLSLVTARPADSREGATDDAAAKVTATKRELGIG